MAAEVERSGMVHGVLSQKMHIRPLAAILCVWFATAPLISHASSR
jgi:hypothetical protein